MWELPGEVDDGEGLPSYGPEPAPRADSVELNWLGWLGDRVAMTGGLEIKRKFILLRTRPNGARRSPSTF